MTDTPTLEDVQAKLAAGQPLDELEQRMADAAAIYVHEPAPPGHASAAVPPQGHPSNAGPAIPMQPGGNPEPPAPQQQALGHQDFVDWVTAELGPRMANLDERMKMVEDFLRTISAGDIADRIVALEARPSVAPETIADLQDRIAALEQLVTTTPEDGE